MNRSWTGNAYAFGILNFPVPLIGSSVRETSPNALPIFIFTMDLRLAIPASSAMGKANLTIHLWPKLKFADHGKLRK